MGYPTVPVQGRECVRGIDVSRWQGHIVWSQVAAARQFAWIKASGGDGGVYGDGTYWPNRANATAAELPHGAYHFIGVGVDGRAQARRFLDVTDGYTSHDLPPVLDIEDTRIDPRIVADFVDELERNTTRRWAGRSGPISWLPYSGKPIEPVLLGVARLLGWATPPPLDLWLAAYLSGTYPAPGPDVTALRSPSVPAPWTEWTVWQWAGEDGRCPGITGPCDQNVATLAWFTRTLGGDITDAAQPLPPSSEDLTMADITAITDRLDAIDRRQQAIEEQLTALPQTLGAWEQDTRRFEGLAPLKLPVDDQQWVVVIVDGIEQKRALTPTSKAGLQLSGQVQTVRFPTGEVDDTGAPVTVDYIEVAGDVAAWLAALPVAG